MLLILAGALLTLLAMRAGYNLFLSPHREIRGPLFGQIFGFMAFMGFQAPYGQQHKFFNALHRKYGSVVRLGPSDFIFSSPRAIKDIYTSGKFIKSPIYDFLLVFGEGHNMLTTPIVFDHAYFRRLMGPAFSMLNLNKIAPLIDEIVLAIFTKIDAQLGASAKTEIDIWNICQAYAFDVIGTTAFGSSFRMVEDGSHPFVTHLTSSLRWMMLQLAIPVFFFPVIPGFGEYKRGNDEVVKFMEEIIQARKTGNVRRVDLLQMLIDATDTEGNGEGLSDEHIMSHVRLFLNAGSETTSNASSMEKKYLELLLKELDACPIGDDGMIIYEDLKSLPWLDVCIKESLRMNPAIASPMFRIAAEDCVVDGMNVPKGCNAMVALGFVLSEHPGWGDAQIFRPERFMNAVDAGKSQEQALIDQSAIDSLYYPFSVGSRNCVGKNMAIMEMKTFLGNFLRRYAIEDIQGQDTKTCMFVTVQLESQTYKLRVSKR